MLQPVQWIIQRIDTVIDQDVEINVELQAKLVWGQEEARARRDRWTKFFACF